MGEGLDQKRMGQFGVWHADGMKLELPSTRGAAQKYEYMIAVVRSSQEHGG